MRAANTPAACYGSVGCKLSAVGLGYWSDPLLSLMVKRGDKKAPEIHLGYYARVMGVRLLIHKFFEVENMFVLIRHELIHLVYLLYRNKIIQNSIAIILNPKTFSLCSC